MSSDSNIGPVSSEVLRDITKKLVSKIAKVDHERIYDFHGCGVWVYATYNQTDLERIHTQDPVYIPLDGTYVVNNDPFFYKWVLKESSRDSPCAAVIHHYLNYTKTDDGCSVSFSTQWHIANVIFMSDE